MGYAVAPKTAHRVHLEDRVARIAGKPRSYDGR